MNKYNELFKQLVSAGLVSPNPAGARWFGQMVARLHAGLVYHNQTPKPFYRSKRVKVKWVNYVKDQAVICMTQQTGNVDQKETKEM